LPGAHRRILRRQDGLERLRLKLRLAEQAQQPRAVEAVPLVHFIDEWPHVLALGETAAPSIREGRANSERAEDAGRIRLIARLGYLQVGNQPRSFLAGCLAVQFAIAQIDVECRRWPRVTGESSGRACATRCV
jgi:hypothetical protein